MDSITQNHYDALRSTDKDQQNSAFFALLAAADTPVEWAYEVWDELVNLLHHKDNHLRAIASQILCNLAKSDPDKRMLKDFDALLAVTRDERFVTARHCLQALWKVGAAGPEQRETYLNGLVKRFQECVTEKNGTLIRYDILQSLRNVYDVVKEDRIKDTALALIETEEDAKYRKRYAGLWKIK